MKILIDGDSCPVKNLTEQIAKKNKIPCHIYCNTKVSIKSSYSHVHIVDTSQDAADFAILKDCEPNDIVVTSDSGLAALILAKKGIAISSGGITYTDENISSYLNSRYFKQNIRRKTHRKQIKGSLYNKNKISFDYKTTLNNAIKTAFDFS